MLQIMEMENSDKDTYLYHEEHNCNEDTNRSTTYQTIETSQ